MYVDRNESTSTFFQIILKYLERKADVEQHWPFGSFSQEPVLTTTYNEDDILPFFLGEASI
jgi:hypothetical protein